MQVYRKKIQSPQIKKTYNDMLALEYTTGCRVVAVCMYVSKSTKIRKSAEDYADDLGITILSEGEINPQELAELVDKILKKKKKP